MINTNKTKMLAMLTSLPIDISHEQFEKLWNFYNLIIEHNDELDLSRLKKFEDIVIKHFIDSIIILRYTYLPSPLVDIGTGAGFPGIPLKIMRPDTEIILAEPRYKRVQFMDMAIKGLALNGISTYPHLVTEKSFFDVNGVITRAFESIENTLHRVNHFLPKNGRVLFMKGPGAEYEIDAAADTIENNYTLVLDNNYTLPGTDYNRKIIIYEKTTDIFKKNYIIFHNETETTGRPITSPDNKLFKKLKKLTGASGIKKRRGLIVSGKKIISDIINGQGIETGELIIFDGYNETDLTFNDIIKIHARKGKLLILKKSLFNEIDISNAKAPLLSINVPEMTEWDTTPRRGCTLLVPFQDPANTGAVIRTAAAFGVNDIVMLKEAANPFHPKSIRSSAGTVFSVDIFNGPSIHELEESILENRLNVVALDKNGADLKSFEFPENFCLLPGLEGPGLPEGLPASTVAIPIEDNIDSLNAAASVAVALYEWKR